MLVFSSLFLWIGADGSYVDRALCFACVTTQTTLVGRKIVLSVPPRDFASPPAPLLVHPPHAQRPRQTYLLPLLPPLSFPFVAGVPEDAPVQVHVDLGV